MKPRRGNFTRGSQLIETFSMLFATGLKPMLWVLATLFSVSLAYLMWSTVQTDDYYRAIMRAYSWFWDYVKFDPDKLVNVVGPGNKSVRMPVSKVPDYPPVRASWRLIIDTVMLAAKFTAIVGLPVCIVYTLASRWIGKNALRRNHERGATIAPVKELIAQIKASNHDKSKAERREEYRRIFGPDWRVKAPLASQAEKVASGMFEPYTIAGVPYPWRTEQTHMFSVGTTGTGKSTMMRDLLDQVRKRGKKAVVFDLTGTFIEGFYDPDRDVILNPFDKRCPQWSIFNDCATRAEFTAAAEAMIPSDGGGAEPFWVQAARLLFVEACVSLSELELTTNRHLYEELMTASLKEVNELVGGTVASPLSDPQAARMAESIRATMNTNINAIRSLPIEGHQFSIKDWVHAEQPGGSVLFIAARHVDLSTVKVLLTLWMDMTINAMMAGSPSPRDARIWFLFDELGALHRLPAIEKGMQTARNYGGAFVLGVHTIAKLRDTYGDDIAETLGSLARTKLILATADYTSAKWCSEQIGNGEWSEMEQGVSFGVDNVRDAITLTNKRQLEPLVLPDDISKLPDLHGWLVFPQGFPAAKIKLKIRHWPKKAEGFMPRPDLMRPLNTVVPTAPSPGNTESGVGVTIGASVTPRLPAPFDAERVVDMPESDTARYERLNREAIKSIGDGRGTAGHAEEAGRGMTSDDNAQRSPREARDNNDGAETPSAAAGSVSSAERTAAEAGARATKQRTENRDAGQEDLTKRETRIDFGQGRDDREDDMEVGL